MRVQEIDKGEWVLRLTPLLKGKAQAVCINLGNTMEYDGVKKAILSHYNVSPGRCQKQFEHMSGQRTQNPTSAQRKQRS